MANFTERSSRGQKRIISIAITGGAILLFLLLFGSRMFVTIHSGEGGVLFRTFAGGVETEKTYAEGFHWIAPWNKMFVYEVRQQEIPEEMIVLSSNGLEITVDVSTWYEPSYEQLALLHQKKGTDYVNRVIRPSIRSATRSVIGRYTPEEIYSSKRDAIQEEIYVETKKILDDEYVNLKETLVRDIVLPATIKNAIEKKLEQEQATLEYKFKLEKEAKEAERIRIAAAGKAKANLILNASLTPAILKEKGIEATLELAKSPNSKVVVIGSGQDGLPLILGNN